MTDQVDSAKVVLDDQGNAITRFEYLPYGEEWITQTPAWIDEQHNPKYNGQELDKETGYYYYNARYYDPAISRFTTADNVIDGELSTQGWNRYLYCHGNPVVYKDPTGHVVEMVWDVASLAMSVGELVDAVKSGSKTDVAIAAASCAVDLAAVLLPGVPGGAGAAVKATKEAGKKIGKEIAEQAVKKGVQEGGEKVVKEGTEKLAKDAAKKAKPDFYVTPSGDAIPGEFHRYASSKHAPIKDAKSGTLPAKRGGTYVSFDKIDDGIVAQGKMEIPYRPDYRVSGDSLDIIDRMKIPKGKFGQADYTEPLTRDYKKFGPGKATQVVVEGNIPVDPSTLKKLD